MYKLYVLFLCTSYVPVVRNSCIYILVVNIVCTSCMYILIVSTRYGLVVCIY